MRKYLLVIIVMAAAHRWIRNVTLGRSKMKCCPDGFEIRCCRKKNGRNGDWRTWRMNQIPWCYLYNIPWLVISNTREIMDR